MIDIGKLMDAAMAPKETNFDNKKVPRNRSKQINAAGGCTPIITPNEVATPLPPLNPAKTGRTCPITANNAQTNFTLIKWSISATLANTGIETARIPLKISISKTTIPGFFPRTRKVFVAPAFLLPCSLTSIPYLALPNQTAVGIEPNK